MRMIGRVATSGYCFKINGGVVSWRSCKQNCVALSTTESEYVSLAGASQEAIWIVQLFSDLNVKNVSPIVIFEDNKTAICIGNNLTHNPRTKHIDIKYHFVRDQVINDKIQIEYCPCNDMIADVFTKPLTAEKLIKLRELLGVVSYDNLLQCEE